MPERVAVIGLGNMGLPIARNLLRAGVSLTVHNRTKTKGEPLVAEGAAWADPRREVTRCPERTTEIPR